MSGRLSERDESLARQVDILWSEVRGRNMDALARNTGALLMDDRFQLGVWGREVEIGQPDFTAVEAMSKEVCDMLTQAMLAYYFHTADGYPPAGQWIAFTELPNGQFYSSAFQGYTGDKLAQQFGSEPDAFTEAALLVGGRNLSLGDVAYSFEALPRVPVAVVCWLGDEDFPPSYRILFDQAVHHYLPTDACAILGSTLTSRLIAAGTSSTGLPK